MSSSMSRFIGASAKLTTTSQYSTSLTFNPISHTSFLKIKDFASCSFHGFSNRSLQCDPMLTVTRRNFVVRSNLTPPPGAPLPSGSPSGSLRSWVVGIVFTLVLPFFTHKWGPLILLKNKVDTVVDTAEHIMEAIEEVAERVDKVIDDFTDNLPENSKLRKTMEAVDEMVEGVAKGAHIANDIIDKVEEAEEKLESFIFHEAKEEKVSNEVMKEEEVSTQEEAGGENLE